jgi:DNA-directed RNA polymerase specialized sigma24 family protein
MPADRLSSTAGGNAHFETTQWALVAAAAAGDQKGKVALESLYRSYCAPVYAFLRRRGFNRQDAQDLTQDFFLHLLEKETFDGRFTSRDELKGWIARSAGNETGAKQAYENASHYYQATVQKWPEDPFPLMSLAICKAALGRSEEALEQAHKAAGMRPLSEDAENGPDLLVDLAQVYLWAGEEKLALEQLLALENIPCALSHGFLRKLPTWDALRGNPRFEQLVSRLKPIPIVNEQPGGK